MKKDDNSPWRHVWLVEGRFPAWFSWIGAVALTGTFFAGAYSSKKIIFQVTLGCLALLTFWLLSNWTLAAIVDVVKDKLPNMKLNKPLAWLISAIITIPLVLFVVLFLLSAVFVVGRGVTSGPV